MGTIASPGALHFGSPWEAPDVAAPGPSGADLSVLVVDDDDTIRDVVVRYLRHEGYIARQATDGESARQAIIESPPNLLILDLMLPGLDGLELCQWLRSAGPVSHVPVIMLTARAEESDRIVGLEIGADDYVVKPFSPRELMQRVKAVLRRTTPPPAPVTALDYGELHLEAGPREVTSGGRLLPLTATEFDLLWCLASHPRVVFSREQLLARVWGYDAGTDVGTSTVTVHVRRLREKLEPDPSAPRWIATIWGVGYRFEPEGGLGSP